MIKLTYPTASDTNYYIFRGWLLGPYNDIGELPAGSEEWRHVTDSIAQTGQMYSEKEVIHQQILANLTMDHSALMSHPTSTDPNDPSITLDWLRFGYSPGQDIAYHGIARHGAVHTSGTTHSCCEYDSAKGQWVVYEVGWINNDYPNYCCDWRKYVLTMKTPFPPGNSGIAYYASYTIYSWPDWVHPLPINVITCEDFDTLITLPMKFGYSISGPSDGTVTCYWGRPSPSILSQWDLESMKKAIDVMLCLSWLDFNSPIQERHYGDLASDACSHLDYSSVNVLAFLSDLRHPQDLIPKLKNLRSLKNDSKIYKTIRDTSDAYLTYKYGVLPTKSDLQNLFRAAQKHKANTDRNGFRVSSAGFRMQQSVSENTYYELQQHLKLAIGNEDSLFLSLIEAMDEFGVLPDFHTIWDFIPYSFVVDWFTQVGDLLERVDTRLRLLRLNIKYVTMSRKIVRCTTFKPDNLLPFNGTITWVQYHRWVSDQCPVPPLSLQSNQQDFNHWLESSALLLQRAK